MPSPTYAQNKSHIYNWRVNHYESYLAIARKSARKKSEWKKIQKVYYNILLF